MSPVAYIQPCAIHPLHVRKVPRMCNITVADLEIFRWDFVPRWIAIST